MTSVATSASVLLGSREKRLLRRLARGKSDAKIALEIGGTERQVAGQRQALISKLGIQSDGQLTTAADEFAPWPTKRPGRRQ
jgi:DNA-binding CsgD family transcriptional regulator